MTQNIDNKIMRKTMTARMLSLCMLFIVLATGSATAQGTPTPTGVVVHGNVYGGGNLADVKGNTAVNICAKDNGSGTYVAVSEGDGVSIKGNVYGGGKGKADEFTCAKAMVGVDGEGLTDNNGGATVRIGNGTIGTVVETTDEQTNETVSTLSGGNVYGGGEIGRVEKNTEVTIGLEPTGEGVTSKPDIKGNVFGAGAGLETHGYSALVRGNSTVTVQGEATVGGSVYGGGEIATVGRYIVINGYPTEPNGGGVCTVTIQDKATIAGNVVGAGKGATPSYSSESKHAIPGTALVPFGSESAYLIFLETLALASETQVTIGGTTAGKTATVSGNVYGGSESGFLQRHAQVTILDNCTIGSASAGGNVYGGGKGYDGFADAGRVSGYTNVTVSGGTTHGSVFGGGELGYVKGGVKVTMTGGTVNHDVYGGGALADTNIGNGTEYVAVPGLTTTSSVTGLYEIKYKATTDGTALDGKIYYESNGGVYVVRNGLKAGDSVSGLYEIEYKPSTDATAALGKTYYEVYVKEDEPQPGVYVVKNGLTAGNPISGLYEITYQETSDATAVANKSYYTITHPTNVDLLGGTIGRDAYGGGLGQLGNAPVEAKVYGDVKLNLNGVSVDEYNSNSTFFSSYLSPVDLVANVNPAIDYYMVPTKGCIVNRVFGCNNLNGTPKSNVTVHVYATQNKDASKATVGDKFNKADYSAYTISDYSGLVSLAESLGIDIEAYNTTLTDGSASEDAKKTALSNIVTAIEAVVSNKRYDLKAVYGGGNEAAYIPLAAYHPDNEPTGSKNQVIIEGCYYTSIETVYGGGNAAPVPEANVTIHSDYEIETVFGGGNGKDAKESDGSDNEGADIGTLDHGTTTYGTGNANTMITGGYIHEAYGGSNERGTIMGTVNLKSEADEICPMVIGKMVTAGKNADIMGDAITVLGCMPDSWVDEYYGGADNANVHGNVELTITSGNFRKVFGGNNKSGIIMGHIKVNIEETGCRPINIDELYLGGNEAAYSYYGYYVVPQTDSEGNIITDEGGNPKPLLTNGKLTFKPRESATDTHKAVKKMFRGTTYNEYSGAEGDTFSHYDAKPELNIISCTHIGEVFGGGLGAPAIMYADPTVNINMIAGSWANSMTTNTTENPNKLGEIGTVYGGGNAADVIGDPTVNICTKSTVDLVSTGATGNTVLGAYITGNVFGGGKGEADNFLCDKAMIGKNNDGIANPTGGTTVNIYNGFVRGNVYGGGQIGRVEKNTVVTIGTGDGVAPGGTVTSAPIIMGSVYGGGAGEEEHGYAALVRGNPTVTIQGNAKVRHSVYGGGEIASVARYNVPTTEEAVQAAKEEGYTEAVLGMPYALKDPSSGTCTVTVQGYAEIGPETAMQMTKAGGPDDTGYVFGAGKGILPGGDYEFEQGTTRRMVLYDATVHTTVGQIGSKWQWVDPDHSDTNKNVWEYFEDLDEYIKFIQTLALSSRTYVTITDNAFVKGSVYGGSENGIVQFNTDVKIQGGQIGAGDGMTEPYKETDWAGTTTPTNGWKECASWTFVEPYAPYDPYATHKDEGKYYYDTNHTQEAAGGASVATDGHTYYGNVFGGGSGSVPYFDHTLGRSVYLHSAGQVKGNTNVTISGGHILTNVYGGNEATNVDGTANVTMTDGTVGVPRTDVQIIAHPLTGYIFGGGKGDQRVFFNKDTNVKDAVVTIEGGRVYGSVYGGGEDGHVMRNVTLTIGKQTTTGEGENAVTTTSGPKIGTKGTSYYDGHVFGGGRGFGGDALTAGNVGGSVDVNILDGEILGSVYGGGRLASVGYGLYLTTENGYGEMRADNEYDGSYTNPSTEDAGDFFTKGRGHINITISGGTIGNEDEYAYDASNPISHTKGGNVFAGGMGRMYELDGMTPVSSLDWWKLGNVKSTKLTISGDAEIKSCVYGGGELGMVQGGNHTSADSKTVSTEIIINGGTIGTEIKSGNVTQYTFGSVFGGGYGSLTEKLDHTGSTNPTYSTYKYTYPKYIAGRVKGSTEVTMTGGEVKASVYGGGEMAAVGESKVLYDSTDPKVLGETLTGNNGAPIEANTYVTISGGIIGKEKVGTTYFGGAKMGNVYGGGSGDNNTVRSGHVYGNTNVNVSNGTIYHNVYGGGAYGSVGDFDYDTKDEEVTVNNQTVTVKKVSGISGLNTNHTNSGVATVKITGGTIGYDGYENGMVFGSSRGDINQPEERDDHTAWVYDANVTIGTAATPAQGNEGEEGYVPATDASGPEIKGSVYGSGENGHTFNNTVVTVNGGTIGIASTDAAYNIVVPDPDFPNDRTKDKTYSGAAYPYRGNVYGAGCGTDKYYENHAEETHDGNGQLFNPLAGIVYGTTTVNIKGGQVVRNVYGAGAMGSVGRTVTTTTTEGETTTTTTTITGGTTTINVSGGTIGVSGTVGDGNVFGAARGNADAVSNEAALVRKETTVSVTGGTVKGNVYGGGELGCVGEYTISSDYRTFTWQDTDGVTNTDNNTKNTGICNVTVDGSSAVIDGHVFGAGKGKEDTFWCEKGIAYSTNVNISKGTVNGNVYGGGEVGRVETDTKVKIGDGVGTVGGASAPTITGSVFGGGAGVETHGYSALVRGNTTVTVEGNATVGHSVYGGGEIASVGRYALDAQKMPSILQGGGYCYVTVKGHAAVDDVFGAGKGVTPHFDKDNADLSKRSRRMTLKDNWESLEGDARFDWNYLTSEDDYSTYLETLALATHPEVTIDGSAAVSGSVFGGGELGLTKGSVIVNIQGGTITEDVYGGGSLANTNTTSSVDRDGDGVADDTPVHPTTKVNLKGGTINRNVYGGGLGRLAKAAVGTEGQTGYVSAVTAVEAKVYGDVLVELNKPVTETTGEGESTTTPPTYGDCVVKGTIFGANNLNGSPQKDVTVHVYKTVTKSGDIVNTKPVKNTDTYELEAVYGGGNLAAFYPDDVTARATAKANVIIDGCDLTSIKSVYGGGNAASTPATEVTVNGTYEIGSVFGGGNGYDNYILDGKEYQNPGANVGYQSYAYHVTEEETGYNVSTHGSGTSADPYKALEYGPSDEPDHKDASTKEKRLANYQYGSGKTQVSIYGGTVHAVYGGSNSKGNVREASVALLDDETFQTCDFDVDEAYGGGKNADMDGTATLIMSCIQGMKEVYGGAEDADVLDNVVLNITNGTFDQVFGGNNKGGRVAGSITVNIEETGCKPVIIGELYGGGNEAPYSKYGYYQEDGKWKYRTKAMFDTMTPEQKAEERLPYADPQVNVKSFTGIGNIFGGGKGLGAVMVADPTLNINVVKGRFSNQTSQSRFTDKGYTLEVDPNNDLKRRYKKTIGGNTVYVPFHGVDSIGGIYNVFGGGNAAEVIGTPHVNVGTLTGEPITLVTKSIEDSEGNAPSTANWTPSYQIATVEGVDIRGNVFGGGNNAEVTGNTDVVIGKNNDVKTYRFTSYNAESGGTAWSSGLAQTTGVIKENLAEVVILTNGKYGDYVGQKYYVNPTTTANGIARTELKKNENGTLTATGLYVAIKEFENKKTYSFTSYGAATEGTEYSSGTATATGNFKTLNSKECMQIVVLTNPGELTWVGKTFYVPMELETDQARYPLYDAEGNPVNVWVSITE